MCKLHAFYECSFYSHMSVICSDLCLLLNINNYKRVRMTYKQCIWPLFYLPCMSLSKRENLICVFSYRRYIIKPSFRSTKPKNRSFYSFYWCLYCNCFVTLKNLRGSENADCTENTDAISENDEISFDKAEKTSLKLCGNLRTDHEHYDSMGKDKEQVTLCHSTVNHRSTKKTIYLCSKNVLFPKCKDW